jgi:hypothetical protein
MAGLVYKYRFRFKHYKIRLLVLLPIKLQLYETFYMAMRYFC